MRYDWPRYQILAIIGLVKEAYKRSYYLTKNLNYNCIVFICFKLQATILIEFEKLLSLQSL